MAQPQSSEFAKNTVYDYLFSFENGMNSGVSPLLLPKNQMAWGSNLTTRGALIKPRPARVQYTLDLSAVPTLVALFNAGTWLFQGKCYYRPDGGPQTLMMSISGRLFQITPNATTRIATVIEVTGGNPQSATAVQCWLWQAENFVFWNDGINLPVFFNGTTTSRSRGGTGANSNTFTTAVAFTGVGVNTPITLTANFTGNNGDVVNLSPPNPPAGIQPPYPGVVLAGAGTPNIVVSFAAGNPNVFVPVGTQLVDTNATANVAITNATVIIPNGYDITTSITIPLTANYNGSVNVIISFGSTFSLTGVITNGLPTNNINVKFPGLLTNGQSNNYVGLNITIPKGSLVVDTAGSSQAAPQPPQFPAGRMGAYVKGRVWMSLTNGKDFIAGDIVGGSSGTKALNFRDAVLNITENNYLVGGGLFTVPGSIGDIRAMRETAELDVSLGQGPLQIFTPTHVFSVNSPVDRLTWQSLTNPILTVSAIGNGGLGQDSTFNVNSDVFYRSTDGIRTLIMASQDFQTWIRTPISHEVERLLNRDNQALLAFSQGVFFDNRPLMSASPISTPQGVYHRTIVALNTDLVTTVRDKSPPAYDGAWPGMNVMGMTTGQFSSVERCYHFVFNPVQTKLELWELLPSAASEVENNPNLPVIGDQLIAAPTAIEWWFESPVLFREQTPATRTFKGLTNGEIMVDKLVGRVNFEVFWKPDQYPCWQPWISWSECSTQNTEAPTDNTKPQFRPRMGLGEPPKKPCDTSTNRPLWQGFNFQVKIVITGQCEFIGARFEAVVLPMPTFAPISCDAICG